MRSLTKLISVNAPDLVLFVGEALVGNEAIDQLVKFNAALADHSQQENPHTIDGIVLTKFDTIDEKVCILNNGLSIVYKAVTMGHVFPKIEVILLNKSL